MHDRDFHDFRTRASEMDALRNQRTATIVQWIEADTMAGDATLTTALLRWRNDIMPRLHDVRPLLIRIPQLFVQHLGLSNQRVLITESHEVLEVLDHNGKGTHNMLLGRVIVPSKE